MLDRAIDGLKSDEAKALREFSDPTSLLLALRSRNCWALANVVLNSSDSVANADANNLSLMASRRSPPAQPSSETVKPTPELVA
jgi:hypothetical protein